MVAAFFSVGTVAGIILWSASDADPAGEAGAVALILGGAFAALMCWVASVVLQWLAAAFVELGRPVRDREGSA
jgi:hypothetical protein